MKEITSTITCPHCDYQKLEVIPTDACLFFYECTQCHTRLRPKGEDCCVFCSYGDVCCPSAERK